MVSLLRFLPFTLKFMQLNRHVCCVCHVARLFGF
jgi:hypothetical protein